MSSAPDRTTTDVETARQRDLFTLLVAVGVAVVLARFVTGFARGGGIPAPVLQVLAADLAVWVPLTAGALWVLRRASRPNGAGDATDAGGPTAPSRLSFGLGMGDAIAALGIVIVCRAVDAAMSISFFGTSGLSPAPTLGQPDVVLLVVSAIGVCVVSPVLEEVVFRGLFQPRLADALTPRTRFLAVLLTAFLFALLHVLISSPASSLVGFEIFTTTFLLGLLTGALVAMTGRIGGAILAHVLFNTVAVVLTWPR
ncbi:CPBP family intramembrane glutamic endopeptidase [Curtobacterium sp. VKM Ac-1395]|uniref:CPBP family intramembrane glutamic endopeptidase n=1 Tax=Curtobacterium sp. VKM Ac-1395 TaxID=2783815 RepID=UPI00188BC043|nr:CPBP family intramembrane glutamic endopeptidase [Curtobacterium sp. VKM Ac-1395]MBF4589292.1 CPBP family intramembrane metalloprotease [Curtobacterium sp. VKM Ac-1395]